MQELLYQLEAEQSRRYTALDRFETAVDQFEWRDQEEVPTPGDSLFLSDSFDKKLPEILISFEDSSRNDSLSEEINSVFCRSETNFKIKRQTEVLGGITDHK